VDICGKKKPNPPTKTKRQHPRSSAFICGHLRLKKAQSPHQNETPTSVFICGKKKAQSPTKTKRQHPRSSAVKKAQSPPPKTHFNSP